MKKMKTLMKNKIFCLILFLALLSSPAFGFCKGAEVPVKVEVKVDKSEVTIGEVFRYSVIVKYKGKDIKIEIPGLGENFGPFGIRDFGEKKKSFFSRTTLIKWYLLDTYVTGEYTIPAHILRYTLPDGVVDEVDIPEVKIKVKSLLKSADKKFEIYDIYEPISPGSRLYKPLLIILIIILIAAGAYFAYSYFRRLNTWGGEVYIPPHVKAYDEIERLVKDDLISRGLVKEFYFRLSLIVRRYLEERFNLRAPEMTTEEFLRELREKQVLEPKHKELLRQFLMQSDMVKFAKYGPLPDEIEKSLDAAKHLIDETKEENKDTKEGGDDDL